MSNRIHKYMTEEEAALFGEELMIGEKRVNQGYQERSHGHTSGSRTKSVWNPKFIAFDGEGYTDEHDIHRYNLVGIFDGKRFAWLSNPEGISTQRFLEWITGFHYSSDYHFCCYSASYDINMFLGDLSREQLTELWNNGKLSLTYGEDIYELEYQPRKKITIRRYLKNDWKQDKKGRWHWTVHGSCVIYDVFGFFQTSFVKTLLKWNPSAEKAIEEIEQGKARRSQFTLEEESYVKEYCGKELIQLVELMKILAAQCDKAGIHPRQWHGVGAIATDLLQKNGIKREIVQYRQSEVDIERRVEDASYYAYFGGRIELLKYGHSTNTTYHYDVNSAYPAAMVHLPSLVNGHWEVTSEYLHHSNAQFALYHVKWNLSNHKDRLIFGPFPFRMPWGAILFPSVGEGWYWAPEVKQALNYYDADIQIIEGYVFVEDSIIRPLSFVQDMYNLRQVWKQEQDPAEKVLKLGLNSLYGKFIQRVGADERRNQIPTFHQIQWAGWITSFTRAKLFALAMRSPENIIAFQTDGIFSRTPLDYTFSFGKELGQWSKEEDVTRYTVVQSGVYWLTKTNGNKETYYRGFDAPTVRPNGAIEGLTEDAILEGWKSGVKSIRAGSTRFVTMGHVVNYEDRIKYWRTWRTIQRELKLYPSGTKRREDESCEVKPWEGLVDTLPEYNYTGQSSAKYPLPWQKWLGEDNQLIDGITQREFEDSLFESIA